MSYYIEKKTERHKIRNIILILTHSCNLNCTYCYEHHKGVQCINFEKAKELIEREMNCNEGYDCEIEFFGGEPFLEFDKIVALHNFLKSREWNKKWIWHPKMERWEYISSKNGKMGVYIKEIS